MTRNGQRCISCNAFAKIIKKVNTYNAAVIRVLTCKCGTHTVTVTEEKLGSDGNWHGNLIEKKKIEPESELWNEIVNGA